MKNLIIGFGSIMVMVLSIMTIAALNINSTNYLDLKTATRMAVYQSMEETLNANNITMIRTKNPDGSFKKDASGNYVYEELVVNSDEALQKLFNENLSMLLKGQNTVTVRMLTCDYTNGILSVNVSYKYKNMGFDRTIDVTQTVIRDSQLDTTPTPSEPDVEATDYVYAYLDKNGELVISANDLNPSTDNLFDSESNFGKCTLPNTTKTSDHPNWVDKADNIKTVRFEGIVKPISCQGWFVAFINLTQIKNIENLDMSKCTNMMGMFSNCKSLTTLDLSSFDTKNVTNMSWTFAGCENLTTLNIKNLNTEKVTTMNYIFTGCSISLLDISGWQINTENLTFFISGCYNLTSITCSQNSYDKISVKNASDLSPLTWIKSD